MSARAAGLGLALLGVLGLAACGGSSSSNGSNPSNTGGGSSAPVANTVPVVSNLGVTNNYADGLFTSVTVCVPGTSNCQTIDNVLVDTGSYGLRLVASEVNLPLPAEKAPSGGPLGECADYVSSFSWGPVATADVEMAGEKAAAVPVQLTGQAGFPAAPTACTNGGTPEQDSQADLGANGVLGVGVFRHDCGAGCAPGVTSVPAVYFSCPGNGCTATLVPLTSQVQNPVWLFAQDNNGVAVTMPAVAAGGAPTASGTMTFGIDTQADNQMGPASVLEADENGYFNTTYMGNEYSGSLLDTGSNAFFILDGGTLNLPDCTGVNAGFYCPATPVSYTATNESASSGLAATSAIASWSIANAADLFNTGYAVFDNLGGSNPGYFDFGLPFFLGRTVFVGINTTTAGSAAGPFYAY